MANEQYFETVFRDLAGSGEDAFLRSDDVRALIGEETRERVESLIREIGETTQAARGQEPASPSSSKTLAQTVGTSAQSALTVGASALSALTGDVGRNAGSVLLKGLSFGPLIGGILSLFRRESDSEAAAPVRFSLPVPIRTEAALSADGRTIAIDRGAGDVIRPVRQAEGVAPQWTTGPSPAQPGGSSSQNITVQVNAMDSRSFLDHSEDIARAVRDAMLHSHSLNDVVNDL